MFHPPRYRTSRPTPWQRVWEFQDNHRLPGFLSRPARHLLYLGRRVQHSIRKHDPNVVAPADRFLDPHPFEPVSLEGAVAWFAHIHRANEAVHQRDGSWVPQPYSGYAACGVTIEEVALRIPGYLAAYQATGDDVYLTRAAAGGEYLLKHRIIPDGHVILLGHIVCDWSYSLAGRALLDLWEHDRSRTQYLSAAQAIAARLAEEPIAGSINHGSIPAQVLARIYRHTGHRRLLDAALRRAMSRLVAFQQPAGDWDGHENRIWYQSVDATTLMQTYLATPASDQYMSAKDALAKTLVRSLNNFVIRQRADGTLALTRYRYAHHPATQEMVTFDGGRFRHDPHPEGYLGHGAFELDTLVMASRVLGVAQAATIAHGYAAALIRSSRLWRLEYNTLGAGRYLELLVP